MKSFPPEYPESRFPEGTVYLGSCAVEDYSRTMPRARPGCERQDYVRGKTIHAFDVPALMLVCNPPFEVIVVDDRSRVRVRNVVGARMCDGKVRELTAEERYEWACGSDEPAEVIMKGAA